MTFAQMTSKPAFRRLKPLQRLERMLLYKPFDALRAEGHVLSVVEAASKLGYTRIHVYRMVRAGKLACIRRGGDDGQVFFLKEQIEGVFH